MGKRANDGEGIIGDAPAPDLGPLFNTLPREHRGAILDLIELDHARIVAGEGRGEPVGILPHGMKWVPTVNAGVRPEHEAKVDDVPIDPRKPEPPTKAERIAAIERLKCAIELPLMRRAMARCACPDATAGVTADDAWELARAGVLIPYRVNGFPATRRSTRADAHGNAHAIYLHPDDPRAAALDRYRPTP